MAFSQQQNTPRKQPFSFFGPDFILSKQNISLTPDLNSGYGRDISPNHGELAVAQGAVLGPQDGATIPNIGFGLRSVSAH